MRFLETQPLMPFVKPPFFPVPVPNLKGLKGALAELLTPFTPLSTNSQ